MSCIQLNFPILFVGYNQQSFVTNPQSSVTSSSSTGLVHKYTGASAVHGEYGVLACTVLHNLVEEHCMYLVCSDLSGIVYFSKLYFSSGMH